MNKKMNEQTQELSSVSNRRKMTENILKNWEEMGRQTEHVRREKVRSCS